MELTERPAQGETPLDHALAHVAKIVGGLPKDHLMVMNMCGR